MYDLSNMYGIASVVVIIAGMYMYVYVYVCICTGQSLLASCAREGCGNI